MNKRMPLVLALSLPCLVLAGCSDDATDAGEDEIGSQTDTESDSSTTATTDTEASGSAETTSTADETTTDATAEETTDATAEESTDATAEESTDATAEESAEESSSDESTDDGEESTTGDPCEGEGPPDFEFSYIWVANSPQGTVSKIDTQGGVELARYTSGPPGSTDPSRTSVSGNGKFAVVVNRNGGITMISAEEEGCVDSNNNGMIDTSAGPNDVMAWGTDECVIWNADLPGSGSDGPRPVSWTIGEQNPLTCEYSLGDVWVGWYDQGANTGSFRLLEGATGNTLDDVDVPNWSGMTWGPYGGAIDSENNFWVTGWGESGPVVKIDGETHEATHYGNPGGWIYGMGLDLSGNTYAAGCGTANVYRFDKQAETWSTIGNVGGSCLRGLQVDSDGVAWIAKNGPCGLAAIDTLTDPPTIIDGDIPLAGCGTPVGVSIDAEGFVWVVDQGVSRAFKVDPDTYQIVDDVGGLQNPYTYSDMTGAGINAQINPQ